MNIKIQESGRMKQLSFSDIEYSNRRKKTKREEFLESMDEIIPWSNWVNIIMPYYYSYFPHPNCSSHMENKGN